MGMEVLPEEAAVEVKHGRSGEEDFRKREHSRHQGPVAETIRSLCDRE